jgi:chaperonin GroES
MMTMDEKNEEAKPAKLRIRPMRDYVIVRRVAKETVSRGGILIPDSAQEKSQRGEVLAVGPGFEMPSGFRVPTGVKPGDVVVFGKWNGQDREIDNEEYLFIVASQIEAVVEPAS